MECFFFEWYQDNDKEGPYGRTFVSNNTQAVETSMKEGGVRSLLSKCSSRQHSIENVLNALDCCAVKLTSLLYRGHACSRVDMMHVEAVSKCMKYFSAAVCRCVLSD